jgi:hypothetical protein
MVECVEELPLDDERGRELFQKLAECDPWYAALLTAGGDRGLHRRCDERQVWRRIRDYEEGVDHERR